MLAVTRISNVRYLTGFTGSAGLLLLGADVALLVVDFRYQEQAMREAAGVDVDGSAAPPQLWPRFAASVAEVESSGSPSRRT